MAALGPQHSPIVVDINGQLIKLNDPKEYKDPSGAIANYIKTTDTNEEIILASKAAVDGIYRLALGGSLNKHDKCFEDGMVREYNEERYGEYNKANKALLFPEIAIANVPFAYLAVRDYTRVTGLTISHISKAEMLARLAEMNRLAVAANAERTELLTNPLFPEVAKAGKYSADKKDRNYGRTLRAYLEALNPKNGELEVLAKQLKDISEFSEFSNHTLIPRKELIAKMAQWERNGKPKGAIEMQDAFGNVIKVNHHALHDTLGIFKYYPEFAKDYQSEIALAKAPAFLPMAGSAATVADKLSASMVVDASARPAL